jgi:hypothetical protein
MLNGLEDIIKEPSIIFRVNKTYKSNMTTEEIYEITRNSWVLSKRKFDAQYAFTVYKGNIKEVFKINFWNKVEDNRWEFEGKVADKKIRNKYLDLSIKNFFKKGEANSIKYVNC